MAFWSDQGGFVPGHYGFVKDTVRAEMGRFWVDVGEFHGFVVTRESG
jgi:hypothetical protein